MTSAIEFSIQGCRGFMRSRSFATARVLAILLLCAMGMSISHAEGGCPPGHYPIGGQGVQGCAPMGGGARQAPAAPRPTGRWIDAWGALAVSDTGLGGAVEGAPSKRDAERGALAKCALGGESTCAVKVAYKNQCAAWLAIGAGNGGEVTTGATAELAIEKGTRNCRKVAPGSECKVFYSACSKPIFEAF